VDWLDRFVRPKLAGTGCDKIHQASYAVAPDTPGKAGSWSLGTRVGIKIRQSFFGYGQIYPRKTYHYQ